MHDKYYNQNFRIKTERALEIINRHEDTDSQYLAQLTRFRQQIVNKISYKVLREAEWNKMQLPKQTSQIYEILNPHAPNQWQPSTQQPIVNFKLVIKNFTGSVIHLGLSNRPQLIALEHCEHKIVDDKIIKIRNYAKNNAKMYLTIHSPLDLTLFKLKYEFEMDTIKERARSLQSSSVKLIKINTREMSSSKLLAEQQKQELLLNFKKGNLSPRSIIKSRADLQTARSQSIERQKQKISNAKIKKADLQLYIQKKNSLKMLSYQCTSIIKDYQHQVKTQAEKNEKTNRYITMLLYTTLFLNNLSYKVTREQHNLQEADKKRKAIKKCAAKFMKMIQHLKLIQPRRVPRALLPVHHHLMLTAKVYQKQSTQCAKQVVAACIQNSLVAFRLNNAFNKCASYRIKIRTIQRYWLTRNKAQLSMLQFYVQKQASEIFLKFPKFLIIRQEFYSRNMVANLSWQYLKQSSQKIKGLFAAYGNKVKQVEQLKAMNIQIDAFNKRSLKKHKKQFVQVPQVPSRPQCRYFRDLSILKSMTRSWLEIEYRRYMRKMNKQNELLPFRQQNELSAIKPQKK